MNKNLTTEQKNILFEEGTEAPGTIIAKSPFGNNNLLLYFLDSHAQFGK